jgi:cytochrome b561
MLRETRLTNSETEYGVVLKALHWSIALLIAFQFIGGAVGAEDNVHATAGLFVLVLATIRLAWRLSVALPDWAPTLSSWEKRLIGLYEKVIYAMLFAKPITGLLLLGAEDEEIRLLGDIEIAVPWGDRYEDLFDSLHFWTGAVLLIALALHIGLVLRHQLLIKDRLLNRMLQGPSSQPHAPLQPAVDPFQLVRKLCFPHA